MEEISEEMKNLLYWFRTPLTKEDAKIYDKGVAEIKQLYNSGEKTKEELIDLYGLEDEEVLNCILQDKFKYRIIEEEDAK